MTLGDGIRRNIAHVDPTERALFRDALLELNHRKFPGARTDTPIPGGVTMWFKQDEIHQATHVHGTPEFAPWHRELCNRLEEMLREVEPRLSLHYWDWTQDPRSIPGANLGGGTTGVLNLFTPDFMGYGGTTSAPLGPPWQNASAPWRADGFYVPGASPERDSSTGTPADPPDSVIRSVDGSPASTSANNDIITAPDYPTMWSRLRVVHDDMHGFVSMGSAHLSFRDPFVFLLHSNADRLFAMWQTQAGHLDRLAPATVYGSDGVSPSALDNSIEPWNGSPATVRPFAPPENETDAKTYKHPSVVRPPCYDTLPIHPAVVTLETPSITFNDVPAGETAARAIVFSAISCDPVNLSITAGPTVVSG
ncbi:MAG: tyrosinase family protein, partial [Propionicimonas sp.]